MKKILLIIILLFSFNFVVKADYSIDNYKIDITLMENGDITVIEAFKLSGDYNGYERIINYKNNYNSYYGDNFVSTDKKLYDGSNFNLEEVRAINFSDDLEDYSKYGDLFIQNNDAKKGERGYYKIIKTDNGEKIRIYNPSKMNKDFYLKYTIKNMIISHKDISEFAFFLFKDIDEKINNIDIIVHLPSNLINLWTHKKNNTNVIDDNTINIKIDKLEKNNNLDFRILFEPIKSNKKSNIIALDKIIKIEKQLENFKDNNINKDYEIKQENAYKFVNETLHNYKRSSYEQAYEAVLKLNEDDELRTKLLIKLLNFEPKIERKEVLIKLFLTSTMTFWIMGLILFLYYFYKKYCFRIKNNNKLPEMIDPALLAFLKNKRVSKKDLALSFIYLIDLNKISYKKKGKYYKFKLEDKSNLTNSQEKLLSLLFNDKKEITLNQINKKSKNDFDLYLKLYTNWIDAVNCEGSKYFYNLFVYKMSGIFYSILGIILGILLVNKDVYYSSYVIIFLAFIFLIIFILLFKRTKIGKEQYEKWMLNKEIKYRTHKKILGIQLDLNDLSFINDITLIISNTLKNAYNEKKSLYN